MPINPSAYAPNFVAPGITMQSMLGMRTTLPTCIFEGTSQFGLDTFYFNDSTSGSGTVAFNTTFVRLSCTTTSGDSAVRQSKPYMPYRVGRNLFIVVGATMGAKKANVRQRLGLFDANNGYFFEQDGTNLKIVSRIGAVDTAVNQSSWNVDKLDGTGRSAVNLDTSKFQNFVIEFSWGGTIRLGVLVDGFYLPCHELYNANSASNAGINTIFLPIRTEITNTSTTGSSTDLDMFFMSAFLEDGLANILMHGHAATSTGRTVASGATVPLISIRLKSAFSRGMIFPTSFSTLQTGTFRPNLVRLVYGGTLTSASFSTASNGVEFDVAATSISGGTTLYGSFAQGSQQPDIIFPTLPPASSDFSGTADIVSMTIFNVTGSSATILGGINWKELV